MATEQIDLSLLVPDPANVRRIGAGAAADEALQSSMAKLGQLQPIRVRPVELGGYVVVLGHRRVAAARALGWQTINAEIMLGEDAGMLAAQQAAENCVRAPMHPVDQWRAVAQMMDGGCTLDDAALALGLSVRYTARLRLLGGVHPAILDWMGENQDERPTDGALRIIASAPVSAQAAAWSSIDADDRWPLRTLCTRLTRTRISRALAIFDPDKAGVRFDEDLFAEADDDENRWTTDDVAGFLAAQKAGLIEQVNKAKKKGGKLTLTDVRAGDLVMPSGWLRQYTPADLDKPLKKADPGMVFIGVVEDGFNVGAVLRRYAVPKPEPAKKATAAAGGQAEGGEVERGWSKRALELVAERKSEAIRGHLRGADAPADARTLLAALVLAVAGRNVSVSGVAHPNGYGGRFADLVARLVGPDGQATTQGVEAVAAEALARMVVCPSPNTYTSSGPAAEWIGALLAVPPPRLDDPECLAVVKSDELIGAARAAGLSVPAKVKAMREAVQGRLPQWVPEPARFGAPGPQAAPPDDDEQPDDAEGADEADDAQEAA